jgi:hypothetical protein
VAYLLKAGAMEPERRQFLASGSGTTFVSRQRLGKRIPAPTDTHATVEILLETACSARCVQGGCGEDNGGNLVNSVREAVKKRDS